MRPSSGSPRKPSYTLLGRQRRRERQVAAGEPLAEAEEVGADALLLAGEHRAGAPKAGCDLVGDQKDAVRLGELANTPQKAGRLDTDARCALDERLDDHRGDLVAVEVEEALEPARVAGVDAVGLEEQRAEGAVEGVDAANRHRADRVAVVAHR